MVGLTALRVEAVLNQDTSQMLVYDRLSFQSSLKRWSYLAKYSRAVVSANAQLWVRPVCRGRPRSAPSL
ncbi:hypothetical protein D1872_353970 [compost metagenome]